MIPLPPSPWSAPPPRRQAETPGRRRRVPRLEAEFLTGRKAVLPDAAKGKVALILMGFTYDSRSRWRNGPSAFKADVRPGPDVTWFEIPVIGGMGRMASWFINSGMRKGTPKEYTRTSSRSTAASTAGRRRWASRSQAEERRLSRRARSRRARPMAAPRARHRRGCGRAEGRHRQTHGAPPASSRRVLHSRPVEVGSESTLGGRKSTLTHLD